MSAPEPKFIGRVKVDQRWERILRYHPSPRGYVGRAIPSPKTMRNGQLLLQGEVTKWITSEQVVNQWVKSLQQEGRSVSVTESDGWITVCSPATD